jgi:hypothetical protein
MSELPSGRPCQTTRGCALIKGTTTMTIRIKVPLALAVIFAAALAASL